MPNWCANHVLIHTSDLSLTKDIHGTETSFDFAKMIPEPIYKNEDTWYHWRLQNWGTKWNADARDPEIYPDLEIIHYAFETPWSPPDPIFRALSRQYNVEILTISEEPGEDYSSICRYHPHDKETVFEGSFIGTHVWTDLKNTEFMWDLSYGWQHEFNPEEKNSDYLSRFFYFNQTVKISKKFEIQTQPVCKEDRLRCLVDNLWSINLKVKNDAELLIDYAHGHPDLVYAIKAYYVTRLDPDSPTSNTLSPSREMAQLVEDLYERNVTLSLEDLENLLS